MVTVPVVARSLSTTGLAPSTCKVISLSSTAVPSGKNVAVSDQESQPTESAEESSSLPPEDEEEDPPVAKQIPLGSLSVVTRACQLPVAALAESSPVPEPDQ